jgi:hypothetical protein
MTSNSKVLAIVPNSKGNSSASRVGQLLSLLGSQEFRAAFDRFGAITGRV